MLVFLSIPRNLLLHVQLTNADFFFLKAYLVYNGLL